MIVIDELPAYPDPVLDDPDAFANKAFAWSVALPVFRGQLNAVAAAVAVLADDIATAAAAVATNATNAATAAANAATSASAAAASALTALNAPGTSGTSASNLTVGTGAVAMVTQAGKAWAVGQQVTVARTSDPVNVPARRSTTREEE